RAKSRDASTEIQYKSDRVAVVKEKLGFNSDGVQHYYICIDYEIEIHNGVVVPEGVKIKTPISIADNKVMSSITVVDGEPIEIRGVNTVQAVVPIIANGVEEVIIKGRGSLTLITTQDMQPCIGTVTNTGLSFGRWEQNGKPPRKIIIDGAVVKCVGIVEAFTLGTYGSDFVPQVICKNGGKLVCPETEGERIVTRQAKAPDGSTKISGRTEYGIFKPGMLMQDMISPEVRLQVSKLPESMRKYVTTKTQIENVNEALRLCKMKHNLDVSLVLDGSKRITYAVTATLLQNKELYSDKEFDLENNKVKYIVDKYSDKVRITADGGGQELGDENIVCSLIIGVHDSLGIAITDYDYEVLYEMIPAYYFTDWVKGDKRASVEAYIKSNVIARKFLGKIRTNLKIQELIADLCD
ncbi:MAG: hypothetical protein NC131_17920, partial [Roseburia sp.]|nr:hypothetical protein [Roseburia sp.]